MCNVKICSALYGNLWGFSYFIYVGVKDSLENVMVHLGGFIF